jgi:hypothetical protein
MNLVPNFAMSVAPNWKLLAQNVERRIGLAVSFAMNAATT